ncbi:MAG: DUF1311 domain-containing protein [Proteobacteria bacterium]|nr:DUF1311 domain-containing protein [Pseudomonadota bacterium]
MRMLLAGTALATLFAAAPARADDWDGIDCRNAMTQLEMNVCANKDFRKADRKLNDAYQRLRKNLDPGEFRKLRDAQRAWIQFRDKECTFEAAENEGGSIYPMMYSGCLAGQTETRTRQLLQLLHDRQGR